MRKKLNHIRRDWVLYLILAPVILYFIIFRVWPIINMRLAFFDFKATTAWEWVGLKYFKMIFASPTFKAILGNTLKLSFYKYVLVFPVYPLFAILLNELRLRYFRIYAQVVSYLPHFLSWVAITGIWISFLSPSSGGINQILGWFGAAPVDFMTSKSHIYGVLVLSSIWRSLGWDSIIYFTAILGIPANLYDAAAIDGANRLQIIRNIIMPALVTPMVTLFIINLGYFLSAGFDQVFNFTNDSVAMSIDILDTYIYRLGIQGGQYSLATAVGLLKGIVGVFLVLGTHFTSKKLTGKGVW
ncbi:MAG TPA: ABC transporter permease subunit [Feifaniaceae bacterium]|nr:ABC transporter permease subunit [Feifaniaceae bacterium]